MGVRDRLFRIYWRLERRVAPGLEYAQARYERMLFNVVRPGSHWLDLGCGHTLLPKWRAKTEAQLVHVPGQLAGVDPDLGALRKNLSMRRRVCADCSALPFTDKSFDVVTANMVVEHLRCPGTQFAEVCRVLRHGGRFLFHTPNAWAYPTVFVRLVPDFMKSWGARLLEGRAERDRYRTFYRANTVGTIGRLARENGFVVSSIEFVRSTALFAMVPPLAVVELAW